MQIRSIKTLLFLMVLSSCSSGTVLSTNIVTKDSTVIETTIVRFTQSGGTFNALVRVKNTSSKSLNVNLGGAVLLMEGQTADDFWSHKGQSSLNQFPASIDWNDSFLEPIVAGFAYLAGRSPHLVTLAAGEYAERRIIYNLSQDFHPGKIHVFKGLSNADVKDPAFSISIK